MTLPFVVRAVQPVLLELDREMEEAADVARRAAGARSSGGSCCPNLRAGDPRRRRLAFARAVGEFGSVVLISGNMPFKTEVVVGLRLRARSRSTT